MNAKLLTRGSVEQLNAQNILTRCSDVVLPDGEPIFTYDKDHAFASMCEFSDNNIKFPNYSCVFNFRSKFSGLFDPDT